MALRIRKNGRIFCAAMFGAEEGDTYLDDGIHYYLSVEKKVLVTEPHIFHKEHGEWWWKGNVPEGIHVCFTYYEPESEEYKKALEIENSNGW